MYNSAEYRRRAFPMDAARDLLGIVRGLYRVARLKPHAAEREQALQLLAGVGADLQHSLSFGHLQPGSMGHAAAWRRAERAAALLCRYVADQPELQSIVRHASSPVLKASKR